MEVQVNVNVWAVIHGDLGLLQATSLVTVLHMEQLFWSPCVVKLEDSRSILSIYSKLEKHVQDSDI